MADFSRSHFPFSICDLGADLQLPRDANTGDGKVVGGSNSNCLSDVR